MIGPVTLEAKVHFAHDEESLIGSATVGLANGGPVTIEALHRAIGQTLTALPEGCRLLTSDEFFNKVLVKEKTGRNGNFAVPASMSYDIDALTETARAAYVPEPDAPKPSDDCLEDYEDDDED